MIQGQIKEPKHVEEAAVNVSVHVEIQMMQESEGIRVRQDNN